MPARFIRLCSASILIALFTFMLHHAQAASAYRCVIGKQVTYGDQPCASGQQQLISVDPANPSEADRAAALERAKADKARLMKIEEAEEKQNQATQARQKKIRAQEAAEAKRCAKLALKLKHLRESLTSASAKELPKKRQQLKQTEDQAMLECPQR